MYHRLCHTIRVGDNVFKQVGMSLNVNTKKIVECTFSVFLGADWCPCMVQLVLDNDRMGVPETGGGVITSLDVFAIREVLAKATRAYQCSMEAMGRHCAKARRRMSQQMVTQD